MENRAMWSLQILYAFVLRAETCVTAFRNVVTLFRKQCKRKQNAHNFHEIIFHILQYFLTEHHNLTKFMLFPAMIANELS